MINLLTYVILAIAIAFIVFEMLVPALSGRPMFPMFRRESELKRELAEVKQANYEKQLEETVAIEKGNKTNVS